MSDDMAAWLGERFDEDENEARRLYPSGAAVRLLRETEAKRELLRRYEALEAGVLVLTSGTQEILSEYRRVILPSLAAGYSDRPGYREEWRP